MSFQQERFPFPMWRVAAVAAVVIIGLFGIPNIVENLDASHVMIVQSPASGNLTCHVEPGVKGQWFGKVTKYPRRSQLWFSDAEGQGEDKEKDSPIKIRFNDGGHADISGSIAWEMPLACQSLILIHKKYGSPEALEHQLLRTIVEKSIYMTGPLLSSKESYAEKRNELLRFIDDQISNGVYRTETTSVKEPDPMTGVMRTVNYVKLMEREGKFMREDVSPLREFDIRTFNLSIRGVKYDATVETQIQSQQKAIMQVQTAMADAKMAEQAAITAEKNGEAEAAKAKWTQEVIKAQKVTEAQQKLEVARLETSAAEQEKAKQVLLGQGESERRRLVMAADGALEKKLDAYVKVNELYAAALKDMKQPVVPQFMLGASNGGSTSGGHTLPRRAGKCASLVWPHGPEERRRPNVHLLLVGHLTHFNHDAVIRYCNRPDANVIAMNLRLIGAWNSAVTPRDTVYFLGDFAFKRKGGEPIDRVFEMLNGHKHLILGNHDEKNAEVMKLGWESVGHIKVLKDNGRRAVLCHYPLESWPSAHHGALHFHGHSHGNLKRRVAHRFDVGVDVYERPVSFDWLASIAAMQTFQAADHHGSEL